MALSAKMQQTNKQTKVCNNSMEILSHVIVIVILYIFCLPTSWVGYPKVLRLVSVWLGKVWGLLHLGQSTKHDRVDLGHLSGKWLVICLKRGHYVGLHCKNWAGRISCSTFGQPVWIFPYFFIKGEKKLGPWKKVSVNSGCWHWLDVNKRMGSNPSNQEKAEIKNNCWTHFVGPHYRIRGEFGHKKEKQGRRVGWNGPCVLMCVRVVGGFEAAKI